MSTPITGGTALSLTSSLHTMYSSASAVTLLPPPSFCSVVVRLTATYMQALEVSFKFSINFFSVVSPTRPDLNNIPINFPKSPTSLWNPVFIFRVEALRVNRCIPPSRVCTCLHICVTKNSLTNNTIPNIVHSFIVSVHIHSLITGSKIVFLAI